MTQPSFLDGKGYSGTPSAAFCPQAGSLASPHASTWAMPSFLPLSMSPLCRHLPASPAPCGKAEPQVFSPIPHCQLDFSVSAKGTFRVLSEDPPSQASTLFKTPQGCCLQEAPISALFFLLPPSSPKSRPPRALKPILPDSSILLLPTPAHTHLKWASNPLPQESQWLVPHPSQY